MFPGISHAAVLRQIRGRLARTVLPRICNGGSDEDTRARLAHVRAYVINPRLYDSALCSCGDSESCARRLPTRSWLFSAVILMFRAIRLDDQFRTFVQVTWHQIGQDVWLHPGLLRRARFRAFYRIQDAGVEFFPTLLRDGRFMVEQLK